MKNILKLLLSAVILFGAAPTINAMDMSNMAGMEEIKKKKKNQKEENEKK